jgi:hypothetical protein
MLDEISDLILHVCKFSMINLNPIVRVDIYLLATQYLEGNTQSQHSKYIDPKQTAQAGQHSQTGKVQAQATAQAATLTPQWAF